MTDRSKARPRTVRFSPYLLAVALAPVFLQTNTPLSCSGDNTLSELEMFAQGENQIVGFDPNQRSYSVSLPSGTDEVQLRAVAGDPGARVWVDLFVDGEQFGYQDYGSSQGYGVGGTDVVVPIPLGSSVVRAWVSPPGGATGFYDVGVESVGEAPAFVAGPPVAASGPSPLSDCEPQVSWLDAETEPWLAVNPTDPDNLVGMWIQDLGDSPIRARGNAAGVSFDGGETWESAVFPGLTQCTGGAANDALDPWLAFAANGDLYAASLISFVDATGGVSKSDIVVNKSVDGGRTWSDIVTVDGVDAPMFNDKESITADPVDACTLYVAWTRFLDPFSPAGLALVSRTTDCGQSWTEPSVIADTAVRRIGLQILVMPDGSLRAFSAGEGKLTVQQSMDQGDTWSQPILVANRDFGRVFTVDGTRIRSASNLFDVAIDRNTGHLYMVWEHAFATAAQVAFSSSADGGSTWSAPVRVDQTPPFGFFTLEQAFLPSVAVADDGTVGVTYYNFQNAIVSPPTSLTDHWFVHCNPATADCTAESGWAGLELRLTPQSFDYLRAPFVSGGDNLGLFLGDYVGLAASGPDFLALFPVTTVDEVATAMFVPVRAR